MTSASAASRRAIVPLLLVSGVVVLVVSGFARGVWLPNLHNGLLGLAFTFVGAYVLFQRPGHREGLIFMATGVVEAVMFFGRQIAHYATAGTSDWWGWLGVWPVAIGLGLTTLSVIYFPDGRLPSPRWRWVVSAVAAIAISCAALSAAWPVEYAATGVRTAHPLALPGAEPAASIWNLVAHPAYAGFQILWVAAVVARWRGSGRLVRLQLSWVGGATIVSAASLIAGVALGGSPRAGLLSAALVPVAAGWAIVHGQYLAAYTALSWLSRAGAGTPDLPATMARAVAEALAAPRAALWIGDETSLHAVGVWPEEGDGARDGDGDGPMSAAALRSAPDLHVRTIEHQGMVAGAITVARRAEDRLSLAQERLLDHLSAQAALVIEHLNLADIVARQRSSGSFDQLSPREREVLELMARGLSNAAICAELHLSIKTVEPIVSAIFTKLELNPDSGINRRVLAVLAFLRT